MGKGEKVDALVQSMKKGVPIAVVGENKSIAFKNIGDWKEVIQKRSVKSSEAPQEGLDVILKKTLGQPDEKKEEGTKEK